MKRLQDRILAEGIALNHEILKVDGFLNHQVDTELMQEIAEDFAAHFAGRGITKVVTIESSGIAPALLTARELGVPMVILKKQPSRVIYENLYQTMVTSYTKETSYELTMSKEYILPEDHVLIVDDFLANGEAAAGAVRLIRMAHATVCAAGVLIEKVFHPGREKLEEIGISVYAQCRIKKLEPGKIELVQE